MAFNDVEVKNRGFLESEFEQQGLADVVEQVVEVTKDEVSHMVANIGETIIVSAKVIKNDVVRIIRAHYILGESEDRSEDGLEKAELEFLSVHVEE